MVSLRESRLPIMRILCLGNSLTVGFQSNSNEFVFRPIPYTKILEKIVESYLIAQKSDMKVIIINKGICGDCTSNMLERFDGDVIEQHPDYAIIMGGTNDIGWGINPTRIFNNLKKMYDKAENNGIASVACTIPSILDSRDLIPPRLELNNLIKAEAERRNIGFIDLFRATVNQETNELIKKYSSDGLHLNTKGYKKIGEFIFSEWLKEVLDQ